ncbi:hypothetical protein EV121DRAFT_212523 [Schizophyllum commune]
MFTDILRFDGARLQSQKPEVLGDYGIERCIRNATDRYHLPLKYRIEGHWQLPQWESEDTDDHTVDPACIDFLHSLKLPVSGERPSLLLHEIGAYETTTFAARLQNIFQPGQHSFLMNSTGTGKTRLLFEGLTRHWGLYIPCSIKPRPLGSTDMRGFFHQALFASPPLESYNTVFEHVLLSRLVIFKLFLECLPDVRAVEHRAQWLLLQLLPDARPGVDIFRELVREFDKWRPSPGFIRSQISDTLLSVRRILGRDESFFCVVDDADHPNMHRAPAFAPSTALREMARAWDRLEGLSLILSGSDINMAPFMSEGSPQYRLCSDTGSFDNPIEHAAYLRRYSPPQLASSESGERLITRACLWLRGRYRITTAFIDCLIAARFAYPHTLLTVYVAKYGGVEPTDGPLRMSKAAIHRCRYIMLNLIRYDPYERLAQDPQAWTSAEMVVQRMMVFGQDTVKVANDCTHLVSCEFAMFSDTDGAEAAVYEPFYVFPVLNMLYDGQRPGSPSGLLSPRAASELRAPPHHPSLHLALIPLLLMALRGQHRLCDLFELAAPYPWAKQTCKLVSIACTPGDAPPHVVPFHSTFPNDSAEERWGTEDTAWLRRGAPEPFCVSTSFSHADVLCVVQLDDGQQIYVALRTMLKNAYVDVPAQVIQDQLSKMLPDRIFQVRTTSLSHPLRPMSELSQEPGLSFGDLPRPVQGLADTPVLRAFATFPEATEVTALPHDASPLPVAALNISLLSQISGEIPYISILRRVYAVLIIARKKQLAGDNVIRVRRE